MLSKKRSILRLGTSSKPRYSAGVGNIFLPNNIERDLYIKNCFRTNTISILDENGQFLQDCFVDKHVLQYIDFPEDIEIPGSSVAYITIPYHNKPIIIAVISKGDETNILNEDEFRFFKEVEGKGTVMISGRANEGNLLINVESFGETGGNLKITVGNSTASGSLNLEVKGKINLEAADDVTVDFDKNINLISHGSASFINVKTSGGLNFLIKKGDVESLITLDNAGNMIINPAESLTLFNGSEPILLGDTTKSKLEEIIDGILALTVPTALGPSGVPINAATFTQIKIDLGEILSTKVKTD